MAYWNSKSRKIVYRKPKQSKFYPGWNEIDCGCCGGIEWGGEEPRNCTACCGGGIIFEHKKSGVQANYPGGPFIGKISKRR